MSNQLPISVASALTCPWGDAGDEVLQTHLELLEAAGAQLDLLVLGLLLAQAAECPAQKAVHVQHLLVGGIELHPLDQCLTSADALQHSFQVAQLTSYFLVVTLVACIHCLEQFPLLRQHMLYHLANTGADLLLSVCACLLQLAYGRAHLRVSVVEGPFLLLQRLRHGAQFLMPLLDLLANVALEIGVAAVQQCTCATQRLGAASAVDAADT